MIRTGNGTFSVDAHSTNGGVAKISTGSVITPSLVQAEDFSIVFSENQPTAGSYAIDVSALASFDFSGDQVSFDVDATTVTLASDVTDAAGMAAAIATALGTSNYAVSENAGTITIARTATGASSTAPVISNFDGDVDLGGAVIADFISGGLSVVGSDAPTNPPQFEYSVINDTTGVTVLANQTYTDGGVIAFNGIQVEISGEPADGDVFSVEASRNQDMFNILSNLINSMESPVSDDVRGVIGGDFVNNGFDVGDVIDFNMQFNDQFIPINFTVGATTNASIAGQIFTEITAVAGATNPDGSVTIAGTDPDTDITFRLNTAGTEIEFISSGGTRHHQNTFSINNLRDSVANDATFGLTASGNTIASSSSASTPATATNIAALRTDISAGLDLSAVAAADRTFSLEVDGVTLPVTIPAVDYTAAPVGVGDGTSAALLTAIDTAINAAFGSQVATASESAVNGLALSTTSTGPGTTITVAESAGVGAANLFGAVIPQITVANGAVSFLSGTPHRSFLSQQIDNALNNINQAFDSVTHIQTSIGGRLNAIDSQLDTNAAKKEQMQKIRSDIRDLDMAEAISNITFQTSVLQIAQQTFVKIQNLSLFNFI
ncbi:MAG: flagellin, partial [Gammaproteobacteria bacterium]|nr:flagellin [Gammaproteobacteria bacterium]